jgi:uncharacterized membrane protein
VDYRIKRFGVASTALTVAVIYFVLGLVVAPLLYMVSASAAPDQKFPGLMFVLGPFFYAVFGYVLAAFACLLYNVIAGWTGGVALRLVPGEA